VSAPGTCWMSVGSMPHALGAAPSCLMCAIKRMEDAARVNAAVVTGVQRPAEPRAKVAA
jgi:hypothetical protein